jgi:hypothetical protein
MDKSDKNGEPQEFKLPIPRQNKTDLERAKLYLDLKKEFKKNIWWYLTRVAAAVPIATLIVTAFILFNQYRIEERRFESEIAKQFAATVKDLNEESNSTRLGAVLALENFIERSEHYRSQVYLLLWAKLGEETSMLSSVRSRGVLITQIMESFRKVSQVRLDKNDTPIKLVIENHDFGIINLRKFDLRIADFSGARLYEANLRSASFGVFFDRRIGEFIQANLSGSKRLKAKQLVASKFWQKAILDSSLRAETESPWGG